MKSIKDYIIWIILFIFGAVILVANLCTAGTVAVTVVGFLLAVAAIMGFLLQFFGAKKKEIEKVEDEPEQN